MVQSVIQWGKNPVVVIKQQDDHVKSVKKSKPQNAKDGSTKRKSRQDAKDDRLLIKKLKEDDAMAVRSDRQQSELRALNAELEKLKGSTAINEAKLKCGLCCKSYSVPLDRKTAGKVSFFKTTHFNECQKKRAGVKGVRTLENFFAKAAAQRLPEPTSSILPVSNEDEQDQFDGADAIVSENESDDFDIGSPSATAFPADLEEGDCGEEKIECGSVESESDKSDVPTSNDEDDTEDLTADDLISCTVCVERAHPLAEKLNKLIKEGKIPEECLFYKYLNDTTSFALIDSSKASDFHWDHEVCEFFETVKYLGGQRTRNFLRGP